MNLYIVTLVDGSRVEVNGETIADVVYEAQAIYGQAVTNVTLEKEVIEQPPNTFESLQRGGPNL